MSRYQPYINCFDLPSAKFPMLLGQNSILLSKLTTKMRIYMLLAFKYLVLKLVCAISSIIVFFRASLGVRDGCDH